MGETMELATLLTMAISYIVLIVTLLTYNLKLSVKIYGDYCIASDSQCEDRYVSTVLLENKKDRAIAIFGIYLHIKPNLYIELTKYDTKPLILEPFATYREDFGPIQYYSMNMNKVNLNKIFDTKKSNRKTFIVLSTSMGKYIVKKTIKRWEPVGDFFKNHYTWWIKQQSIKFQDKFVGSNIKYIIIFKIKDKEHSMFLEAEDYRLLKYRNIQFTKDSLENKDNLTKFVENAISEGKIKCDDFTILISDDWKGDYELKVVEAPLINWFQYYVIGKIATICSDLRLRKINKMSNKKQDFKGEGQVSSLVSKPTAFSLPTSAVDTPVTPQENKIENC